MFSLNTFIKFERDVNPLAKQTSVTLRHLDVKSFLAYDSLMLWKIKSNSNGKGEAAHKRGKWSDDYRVLKDIHKILNNAVLLDTVIASEPSKRMGKYTILVHHLYCPIRVARVGEVYVLKIYVSEHMDGGKKCYLNKIEKISFDTRSYIETKFNAPRAYKPISNDISGVSIAELFEIVELKSDYYFDLGDTLFVLRKLNVDPLHVIFDINVMYKMTSGYHSIYKDDIKELPRAINDPIIVFKARDPINGYVLVTDLNDKFDDPVIVAIHLNKYQKKIEG